MKFTNKKIQELADIACIEVTDQQKSVIIQELSTIVNWVNQLKKIDTTGIPPQHSMCTEQNRFAEPQAEKALNLRKVLLNAPVHDSAYFHIPMVSNEKIEKQ